MSGNKSIATALKKLRLQDSLFRAAYPGYPGNFTRDSIIYGLLADDSDTLERQVAFCAENQGKAADALTGEEPGKIHHELPGVDLGGAFTTYAACDTTALFLLAIARLSHDDPDVIDLYRPAISEAIGYIKSHLQDDLFYEDPALSGAQRFALHVTYWKDSALNGGEPASFPIVYTLAHIQNAAAIYEMGSMLAESSLIELGEKMFDAAFERLWAENHFIGALDGKGTTFDMPSTDSLFALYFLPPERISLDCLEEVERYTSQLETAAGYRAGLPHAQTVDRYHTDYVWVFEQAIIHAGGRRHARPHVQQVAGRVTSYLDKGFPELLHIEDEFAHHGSPLQLWSVGAARYFESVVPAPSDLEMHLDSRVVV